MTITVLSQPIHEETVFNIVDKLSMGTYGVYAIILNKLFNIGAPYDKKLTPTKGKEYYEALKELERSGLIEIS